MAYVDITYARDPATGAIVFDSSGYPVQETTGPNTTANTYQQLYTRTQYEVLGAATTADVQNAIQDSIAEYEATTFHFNTVRYFGTQFLRDNSGNIIYDSSGNPIISQAGFMTVQGKEIYGPDDLPILVNMPHISTIQCVAFNNRYDLVPRTYQWMNEQSVSLTWQGLPTDWATSSGTDLRIYPVPNGAYPLILDCTIRFAPLVNDSDFNPWTNRAEALIRYDAKRRLFLDISRDAAMAAAMEREIVGDGTPAKPGILARLKRENQRRQAGPGKLRPSRGWF